MLQTKHFIFLKKAYSNQDTLKKFPNLIYKLNFPVKLQRMSSDQLSKKFPFFKLNDVSSIYARMPFQKLFTKI